MPPMNPTAMSSAIATAKIGAYAVAISPITNRTNSPNPKAIRNHLPYMTSPFPRVQAPKPGTAEITVARNRTNSGASGLANAHRPADELIPPRPSLAKLRKAADGCRACPLWRDATQTVFGQGSARARLMLVGEQPGDREDSIGEPFVGPAGEVLSEVLEGAGIDRGETYVTNAVKHFKWTQGRGKRRLHQRPNVEEVQACRPWLDAELAVVRPEVLVCLGATAAKALLGSKVRVTRDRGRFLESELAPAVSVTVHPSSILRINDARERRAARGELTADLRKVAARLDGG
jgi:uracil-DNA glycosylase family protein